MTKAPRNGMLIASLGVLLALNLGACSGSSPAGAPGAGNVPQAAPGVGSNPSGSVNSGAPDQAPTAAINFTDPGNLPFADPVTPTSKASGLFFAGNWTVNGGYYQQSEGAKQASLSFREYTGNAFGSSGGATPAKYRADVTAWVYQQSDQYPNMVGAPLGIIGYAPYFIDETHYLLAVAKPDRLEVWATDGFVPGQNWPETNLLWSKALATPLAVGTPVAWSVQVDTTTQSATIWANGTQQATVKSPMLANPGEHVALVSNGNYVHFQDFKLYAE